LLQLADMNPIFFLQQLFKYDSSSGDYKLVAGNCSGHSFHGMSLHTQAHTKTHKNELELLSAVKKLNTSLECSTKFMASFTGI
jgi:hypothetical protein